MDQRNHHGPHPLNTSPLPTLKTHFTHSILPVVCSLLLAGCTNSIEKVHFFDRKSLPHQTLEDAEIVSSRRGHVENALTAPAIEQYEAPDSRTVYPKGIKLVYFSDNGDTSVTLQAQYAISWRDNIVLMARDSVVIINYDTHDTVYMDDIAWNREEGRVFSNHPIQVHNGPQVTYGDSFHSDDSLKHMQIANQRGVIVIDNDE